MYPDVWCYTIKHCQEHISNLNAQHSDRLTSSGYVGDGEPEVASLPLKVIRVPSTCVCGRVSKFNRFERVHHLDYRVSPTQYEAMMRRS